MADLSRRDGIELVRTGSWNLLSGSWNPTREDILSAVKAQECPAIRKPIIRLGHTDKRFVGDGEPALGWFENLRAAEGGHTLVADQVTLPWLDKVQAAAYPDRSVEGNYNHTCALGHRHPFVITAVALLGVTPPGVATLKSLQDLPEMLGVAASQEVPEGAEHVEVTIRAGGGAPEVTVPNVLFPVRAASDANLRDYWVRGKGAAKIRWGEPHDFDRCVKELRSYVSDPKGLCAEYHHEALGAWPGREHVKAGAGEGANPMSRAQQIRDAWNASNPPHSQWVQEARADAAIVVDDVDRTYQLYPVTFDGDQVTFGDPQPYDPAADKVLVYASRAESRPDVQAAAVSDKAWSPKQGDYTPAQWKTACLIDTGTGAPDDMGRYALPVREPDGTLNRAAVHAAAARLQQVQASDDAKKAAAAQLVKLYGALGEDPPPALRFAANKKVAASDGTNPELPAAEPEPENTDPKEDPVSTDLSAFRSRLGLDDTADEQAILSALDALKVKAETSVEPTPEMVAASAAAETEKDELRKEVTVLASQVQTMSSKLATAEAEKAATVKASVLADAKRLGKFTPADEEQWAKDYDEAPGAITRVLASIAPGTAVPVMASGTAGSPEPTMPGFSDDELTDAFFGPGSAARFNSQEA